MFIRLFYSPRCAECSNLWTVIKNENIEKLFIVVCVDNFTSKEMQQLDIKEVPAIILSAENQPSALYEGPQKCSEWLTNFTINRRKNIAHYVETQRKLIQNEQATIKAQEGILEYTEAEMDGITDNYSFNHTELYQPKSFVTVGNEDKFNILTPIVEENKITNDVMRKNLLSVNAARDTETKQIMQTMEQNQIKKILNYNNIHT